MSLALPPAEGANFDPARRHCSSTNYGNRSLFLAGVVPADRPNQKRPIREPDCDELGVSFLEKQGGFKENLRIHKKTPLSRTGSRISLSLAWSANSTTPDLKPPEQTSEIGLSSRRMQIPDSADKFTCRAGQSQEIPATCGRVSGVKDQER